MKVILFYFKIFQQLMEEFFKNSILIKVGGITIEQRDCFMLQHFQWKLGRALTSYLCERAPGVLNLWAASFSPSCARPWQQHAARPQGACGWMRSIYTWKQPRHGWNTRNRLSWKDPTAFLFFLLLKFRIFSILYVFYICMFSVLYLLTQSVTT